MLRGSHAVVFATAVLDKGERKKQHPAPAILGTIFQFSLFLTASFTVNIKG